LQSVFGSEHSGVIGSMTPDGLVAALAIGGVAVAHAVLEARAYARASGGDVRWLSGSSPDPLWVLSAVAIVAFLTVAVLSAATTGAPMGWRIGSIAAGLAAAGAGIRLRCLAIEALGAGFAAPPYRARPTALADQGLYASVRHPSELGLLLIAAGVTAIASTLPAALMLTVTMALAVLRIVREERWLSIALARQHSDFRRRTPRLVMPRLADLPSMARLLNMPRVRA
jgi:protein-S-isoprenylcysteine O-methyltransferase Ste14